MFTEQTLNGEKRTGRPQGSEQEVEALRQKATKLKLFIYTKKVHDSIIKMLKAGKKSPVVTLGRITAEVMTKFEKDGGEVINDPDVLEGLSKALIKELITLAVSAEVLTKDQVNSDMLFRIVGMAQAEWDRLNPDRVDKARSQRMMERGQQDPQVVDAINKSAQQKGMRNMTSQQPDQQAAQMPQEQM